jgi:hypothetical protein
MHQTRVLQDYDLTFTRTVPPPARRIENVYVCRVCLCTVPVSAEYRTQGPPTIYGSSE